MPLSTDSKAAQTGEVLLHTLKDIFHPPPGFRPGQPLPHSFSPSYPN